MSGSVYQERPSTAHPGHQRELDFPFRANTVARKAQSPGITELQYQLPHVQHYKIGADHELQSQTVSGDETKAPVGDIDPWIRRGSGESDTASSIGEDIRTVLDERMRKEEGIGKEEEEEEIMRAAEENPLVNRLSLEPIMSGGDPSEVNTAAALREEAGPSDAQRRGSDLPAEQGERSQVQGSADRKRIRKEKLAEKLMEVFGLERKEEVLEEMRCWLLRSVSKSNGTT
jgi:sterol 3beta-glucosyltransferase